MPLGPFDFRGPDLYPNAARLAHIGRSAPRDQFLQELQLRSKEPTLRPKTVTLMTIHGAKGQEFDFVYVIGLPRTSCRPSTARRRTSDVTALLRSPAPESALS